MLEILVTCAVSFVVGGFLGKKLAARGITANTNLEKHQGKILLGLIAAVIIIVSIYLLNLFNLIHQVLFFVPPILLLYIGAYPYEIVLIAGFFVLGLLLFLELSGKSSFHRKLQLFFAIAILTAPLTVFLNSYLPLTNSLGESIITQDGIVFQSTSYTCAPSSIATLARFTKKHPNITEKDVVKLTKTNKFGTSTLAEIRAMEKLGLNPEYKNGLTIQDLVKINQPGVLHVRLKSGGRTIGHAVALLSVDPAKQVLIIADPLSGMKEIKFSQLKGYWFGEIVLIRV